MKYNVNKMLILTSLLAISCIAQDVTLDEISVEYKEETVKQKVFKKAAAISTKEDVHSSTKSVDNIIRSVPGAFTNIDKSSGSVSMNVRGMSGFGRVNTMIDGVSQTFHATSSDSSAKSGGTSSFGANVDPNFISTIDIQRGSFSGKGGANSLMGSANFNTIGINDIIQGNNDFGVITKISNGGNAIKTNFMTGIAAKYNFNSNNQLGFLYGFSKRQVSQNYYVGDGLHIKDVDKQDKQNIIDMACTGGTTPTEEAKCREEYAQRLNREPFDPAKLENSPVSHIAKIEYLDEFNSLALQYRTLQTALSGRKIINNNYQLNYNLTNSDNIDLNLLYAINTGIQKYNVGTMFNGKEIKKPLEAKNISKTFDIGNTFSTELPYDIGLTTTIGMNLLRNKYSKNRHPKELAYHFENGEPDSIDECPDRGGLSGEPEEGHLQCVYLSTKSNAFQPDGEQKVRTLYIDNTFEKDIYKLNFNINKQRYQFSGTTFHRFKPLGKILGKIGEYNNAPIFGDPETASLAKRYLDEFGLDFAKQYCDFAPDDYNDPDHPEDDIYHLTNCKYADLPIIKGGQGSTNNYSVTLSADFHELFMPFVTYSRTHRMPNIKEIFFSEIGDLAVRTDLRPEKATTTEIGFNSFKEGVFGNADTFGFKFLVYNTKIKDYIVNAKRECNHLTFDTCYPHITHLNYPESVNIKGLELELSYDIGYFYTSLAYARQKTNQPSSYADASATLASSSHVDKYLQGFGLSKVSMLPNDYGSLDIGTRLYGQKLTIGTTAKYYGKSKRANLDKAYGDIAIPDVYAPSGMSGTRMRLSSTEIIDKQPVIFDFYVIFQPIKNLTIKAEIQNFFDKRYIDPLDSNNDSANQTDFIMGLNITPALNNYARGRTGIVSFIYKY